MIRTAPYVASSLAFFIAYTTFAAAPPAGPLAVSGRYPHLAYFNHQGECGTGAVVPWANRLWIITYGPHLPKGSDDKLYEIDNELQRVTRPESVGGTPANRMIHRESRQLNIGPYFIDENRKVRVIPPSKMYGRLTATARHLTDPAHKVYICDMEGLIYEVDVQSLEAKLIFKRPIPGWHSKGGYSGQGRLVLANNGEEPTRSVDQYKPFDYFIDPTHKSSEDAGALAEWDGRQWRLIQRRQFTDVTGPGGIHGPPSADAPLWAIGWDRRSLMLEVCQGGTWHLYRLPIADFSYVATHGWHTEWPRIREVGEGKFLMNLHGGWFDFPAEFAPGKTGGLRPLGDYLKITGDFCAWNGRIVFGCDDTARSGFSGPKQLDTGNRLNGQSCSNLWFTTWEGLSQAGRPAGSGGVWLRDPVAAGTPSDPYLLAGYTQRVLHLAHHTPEPVTFTLEVDRTGNGQWTAARQIRLEPREYVYHLLADDLAMTWVRLKTDRAARNVTAWFHCGPGGGARTDRALFAALADIDQAGPWTSAVVRSEGEDKILLGVRSQAIDAAGNAGEPKTWQVGADLKFTPTAGDSPSARFLAEQAVVRDRVLESDAASLILNEGKLRVRLPKAHAAYDAPWATGWPRAVREVVTERSLLNAGGSFFLLPRENSGGLRRIKPIATHNKRITDFCSWRGLLVIAGCAAAARSDGHAVTAPDGKTALWMGDIDDLWKFGKPVGSGGPWRDTSVTADKPSDPYLMAGYDQKQLVLSHDASREVSIRIEVDLAGDGIWLRYATFPVAPGKKLTHAFPAGYSAHWIRLTADRDCKATATLTYR